MSEPLRLAIVGSRSLEGFPDLDDTIRLIIFSYQPTQVVTGYDEKKDRPVGVDKAAFQMAKEAGIPVQTFVPEPEGPARWQFARAANARNQKIVDNCDALVAIMVPEGSPGTLDSIQRAHKAGKRVQVLTLGEGETGTLFG